jgi:recombination protein RecA
VPKKEVEETEPQKKLTPDDIRKQINAHLKSNQIVMGSDDSLKVEYISTGILPVDDMLNGGLARGRFHEIYGEFSSLKTYIGYKAIAERQRNGEIAALIDTERSFDPEWAGKLGVDLEKLILWPNLQDDFEVTAESALDKAELFLRYGVDLLVFDSIAAMVPKTEVEKNLADDKVQPANLARLMSRACAKLTAVNKRTAVLFVNQLRIAGIGGFHTYATTTGGKAMSFYASVRVKMHKADKITETVEVWTGDDFKKVSQQIAQKYQAVTEKSKLNAPFKETWFIFDMRTGEIDEIGYLIGKGLEKGLIQRPSKVKWVYKDLEVNGKDAFRTELEKSPLLDVLKGEIIDRKGSQDSLGSTD